MENISNQQPIKKARSSNFDLLKIIAFIFVIVLHVNNSSMGRAFAYAEAGSSTWIMLSVLESAAIIAVPLFVLITGFFSVNNKSFTLKKVVGLYIMQFSYKIIAYLLYIWINNYSFNVESFFSNLVPNNYYVNLYAALMLFSPLLNKLFKFNKKQVTWFLIVASIMFFLVPTIMDIVNALTNNKFPGVSYISNGGSLSGYTIVAFVMFYWLGAYIRTYNITIRKLITGPAWVVLTGLMVLVSMKTMAVWHYDNLLVVASALAFFLLFKEIKLREIKVIGYVAKCSLGVFVLHTTALFIHTFNGLFHIGDMVQQGPGQAVLVVLEVVFATAGVCIVADILLRLAVYPIRKWLYGTKVMNYPIFTFDKPEKTEE